ncbi:hypothetical protein K435DRAFT_874524 [Dendrothele bispora CBS 962.96]|uniref:Uncharacterized protein n=1 Tax=Dendrothele bispora (strain CBS 962.96) TaxID=1314807 RepID=A0A4S8KWH4_DENBC|nr:hypothetical protein K435DRAFT_874524 [Dendrothele bispora CBS 962.96]
MRYYFRLFHFQFIFKDGIGGLLIGYSFGLHLTTFPSLPMPNSSPSMSPLSEKSFIAIRLLPSLLTTFLGSQYKYTPLAFAGVTGGVVFSHAIYVFIHPSLFIQIARTSIIAPKLTLLRVVCLPLEWLQRPSLQLAACSTGDSNWSY